MWKIATEIRYKNNLCQKSFKSGVCHMYRIWNWSDFSCFRSLKKKAPIGIPMRQVICMFIEYLTNSQTHLALPYRTLWYSCTFFPSVLSRGCSDFFSFLKFSCLQTPIHLSRSSANVTSSEKPIFIFPGRNGHCSQSRWFLPLYHFTCSPSFQSSEFLSTKQYSVIAVLNKLNEWTLKVETFLPFSW